MRPEDVYAILKKDISNITNQIKRYGIRFSGSANTGATVTRTYDAVGLVAGVGTDTQTATNDFDNIYPWSARRRCCGGWNSDGVFVVNAYKGEPGYATDGSNGEVWVENSLFYYKHFYDDGVEEIDICAVQLPGYQPAPIFLNSDGTLRQKAYTAAYPMATVNGSPTSRSGVFADTYSQISGMAAAKTLGEKYCITTTAEWYTELIMMVVEFGTRNLQTVMAGATGMPYTAADTATVAETSTNRIIVANATANKYVLGQSIGIGASHGSTSIANNRIVTAIETYDTDNKSITFDGAAVDIAVGNVVWTTGWKNGSCDTVLSSSGSYISNSDGRHNCMYRGREKPYGNFFETNSDILFSRTGEGTEQSPYAYDIYYLDDITKYNAGTLTNDYIKLTYNIPVTDGYVKTLGYDERYPWLRLPDSVGASTVTYYSDYYYYPRYALCAGRVGGSWFSGAFAGLLYWNCYFAPSDSFVHSRARLSYKP